MKNGACWAAAGALLFLVDAPFGARRFSEDQATFIPCMTRVINLLRGKAKSRMGHFLGTHPSVEILRAEKAKRDGGLFETASVFVRLFRDLRRLVVADMRI